MTSMSGLTELLEAKVWLLLLKATGHPSVVNTAFQLAAWRGRVVLLASTRGETEHVNFYRDVHGKGLPVLGAHNSVRPRHDSSPNFWTLRDDWELSLQLIAHQRVVVAPLITHRIAGDSGCKGISTVNGMGFRILLGSGIELG